MARAAVDFSFTPLVTDQRLPALRLTIEGEPVDPMTNNPSLSDLAAMLRYARSGLSAREYQLDRCRWATLHADGTLEVQLSCFVWPSRPELVYSLALPGIATPGPVEAVQLSRQWKFWISGRGLLELPWRLEEAGFSWQPGFSCVNEFSAPIPAPELRHEYATIEVLGKQSCYGVLVVRGTAVGLRHVFTLSFAKIEGNGELYSTDIESVPVSASWVDEDGETRTATAEVAIPPCVRDLLETCSDGRALLGMRVKRNATEGRDIAYSTCTGRVLGMRTRDKNG